MSHHHQYDEENQTANSLNSETSTRHHHLHLKPIHVIDHIKTKVKQKRSSAKSSPEVVRKSVNDKKRTSIEHNELKKTLPLTKTRSSTIGAPETTITQDPSIHVEDQAAEETLLPKQNDEIFSDPMDQDEEIQRNKNRRLSDVDKNIGSKRRSSKSSKALIDQVNQSSTKKRRQINRRTGFQVRDEDFDAIFPDLPSDEQLIVGYPCALRKDIFTHGRMFLSMNYLCFYSCFFKWEESLCIAFKDVVSVTREKSIKLLPNAIKLRTNTKDQYVFASPIPREKIFITIFRLWQNALLEKPLDYQQLRAIVFADQLSVDESSEDSEGSAGAENHDEDPTDISSRVLSSAMIATRQIHSQSMPVIASKKSHKPSNQEMLESPMSKELLTYVSTCPCETHLARTITERTFSYDVDKLYEYIFEDNAFSRAYRDSLKLLEFNSGEWQMNNETGKRERQWTYKTISQSILGTNTVTCNEKQIMEVEIPHSVYVIRTEVYNEGMKYTDTFFVATQYCLYQRDAKHSFLRITAELKYIKGVNVIIKSFIEKNCNASIEDGINNLTRRLENQQPTKTNRKSDPKQISASKEYARKKKHDVIYSDEKRDDSLTYNDASSPTHQPSLNEKTITGKGALADVALFIGIFLLLLHIYLCYKLHYIDQLLYATDITNMNQCQKACLKDTFRK